MVHLKRELNVLLDKENCMWAQRSCIQWLTNRDRNTGYFHGVATQRKHKNFIKGIRNSSGEWVTNKNIVFDICVDFYSRLFTSSSSHDIDRVLEGVQSLVSSSMTAKLTKPYTREEVNMAIKNMAPITAPGPNGMPHIFYQTFWLNISLEVSDAILSCLNSSTLLKSINHTFITLIPQGK